MNQSHKLEHAAFYSLLATIILLPLAFWPSRYIVLEAIKTIVISLGTLSTLIMYSVLAHRERSLRLPPRAAGWTAVAVIASLIASAIASGVFGKSFFGQGFELGTGSAIAMMFAAGYAAYLSVIRRADRVMAIYAGVVGTYLILYILHAFRLVIGPGFATLGFMNGITSTILGGWYGLGMLSLISVIISISAILILPLSGIWRRLAWVLAVVSFVGALVVNSIHVWQAGAVVFLGLAIYLSVGRSIQSTDSSSSTQSTAPSRMGAILSRVAWVPVVMCIVFVALALNNASLAAPIVSRAGAAHNELGLPWQMTVDVAAATLKNAPLLGAGPNRFTQAFLAHKPSGINPTDAWGVEFNSGFGTLPTFAVTQGLIGLSAWAVFLIFFGILGARSLRGLMASSDRIAAFSIISSYSAASFLWIMAMIYVVPQSIFYLAFVMTGTWLAVSVAHGRLQARTLGTVVPPRTVAIVCIVVFAVWAIGSVKNIVALGYFGAGLRELTALGDPTSADKHFAAASRYNHSDVYLQGRVEATLAETNRLVTSAATAPAASTSAIAAEAGALVNSAMSLAQQAIALDPANYYNYLSAAHVAEAALTLRMDKSYEAGTAAYVAAIQTNPYNPSLYVSLARFQASANQLDAARQTIGSALQVKNNYLDAVFLLAQIEAAKGNLKDAITAAQFAVKLQPDNALLYFQLGLFQYTGTSYADAAVSLAEALRIQPDYANAQYFLGLSEARLGRNADAIAHFESLLANNPDNRELPAILTALRAGKSLFSGDKPALSTPPEKRATPPLPEKKR